MTVIQKITEMLESSDIELVRLGVELMKHEIPKHDWELFLKNYCHRFGWDVKWGDSEVSIYHKRSVWEQLHDGYKYKYNIDSFSVETLQEAIKDYFNKKQSNE